jgi:hypothetical protein
VLCGGPTVLAADMARRWRPVRSSYVLGRSLKKRRTCGGNLLDVTVVRSAATTHHVEVAETLFEVSMLATELNWVTNIKFRRLVQLSVALA